MQAVNKTWQPMNEITTPLAGTPSYISSGIIKAVMKSGDKVSVAQIDYQEFDEENFQYVISPYWEIVDGLPPSVFQGIPGIDMELRLEHYYRANYIPTFIEERTPSKEREDLWALLESVGLDYYDRFEWLLRTDMRSANDNLIVERRRPDKKTEEYSNGVLATMQYGDTCIVSSLEAVGDTTGHFADGIFAALTNGIDIITGDGRIIVDAIARETMVPIVVAHRLLSYRERMENRREGIEKAKRDGKYTGRKPIDVDENMLRQVAAELGQGIISVEEAMRRSKIKSKSTFYRKLRGLRQAHDVDSSKMH